jgi:Flp pilus assembly protein TadG
MLFYLKKLIKINFKYRLMGKKIFRKNEDGTVAIEFTLVAIPFFMMIIGILELALIFTAQGLLEASTAQAARGIRTGAVQQGGGQSAFDDLLCDMAAVFIPCNQIQYQVVPMEDFGDAEDFPPPSFDEDGNLEDQQFNAGADNDVVMIRTVYKYPIKTPMFQLFSNDGAGNRTMVTTIVLKTEPYVF